jgi:L-fuconolactonase
LFITDAQHHEIGPWWDWTRESGEIQHRVVAELTVAYLDAVGVDGAILVPVGDDTAVAWAAAALPERLAFTSLITPETPDLDDVVANARRRTGLLGLRVVIGWPFDGSEARRLEEGVWDPVFAACEKYSMPVFLFVTRWLPLVARVAERFPGLPLIVDHLGLRQPPVDTAEEPPFKSLPELIRLARFQNVHVKLCGLPALSQESYPYADVTEPLRMVCDSFGSNRLMWASDATRFVGRVGVDRHAHPLTLSTYVGKHHYADALHFIRDSNVLTSVEKADLLGGTVKRVLGWAPREAKMP